ncbi:MAG TPA: hypothetical protein VK436_06045 [Methanocella sp.]|nr:hypothetical protein [Methanocella sp.]
MTRRPRIPSASPLAKKKFAALSGLTNGSGKTTTICMIVGFIEPTVVGA